MAALLVWGRGGILDLVALKSQVRGVEAEAKALEQENERLKSDIQKLQTEPGAYEGPARERFFMKKPGETVLYLPPGSTPAPQPPAADANDVNSPPEPSPPPSPR
jgi:cell division protein FtsB